MRTLIFLILGVTLVCRAQYQHPLRPSEIENLTVQPGHRGVKLAWKYSRSGSDPADFNLKICEHSSWRMKRPCKTRYLSVNGTKQKPNSYDVLKRYGRDSYEADIYKLRTLTNYTFALELAFPNTEYSYQKAKSIRPKSVIATTKPFDARASRCLGNSTDVEVLTGPFFGGKITVDQTYDRRCAVLGNPESPNSFYTLTIPHNICGSKVVNNSRIETAVIVHENRELITHNSRKFHVICNFIAQGFTVKASVEVPNIVAPSRTGKKDGEPIGYGSIELEPNEIYDNGQDVEGNNVGDSRFLAEQAAVRISQKLEDGEVSNDSVRVTLGACLTIICGSAILVMTLYLGNTVKGMLNQRRQKMDSTSAKQKTQQPQLVARDDKELLVDNHSLEISSVEPACENPPNAKDEQYVHQISENRD